MQNDDYDDIAFDDLMSVLGESKTHIMTRGVPGRHNDDSATITSWFVNFYHIILNNYFGESNMNQNKRFDITWKRYIKVLLCMDLS